MQTRKRVSDLATEEVDLFPELSWFHKKMAFLKVKIMKIIYILKHK